MRIESGSKAGIQGLEKGLMQVLLLPDGIGGIHREGRVLRGPQDTHDERYDERYDERRKMRNPVDECYQALSDVPHLG